jgi:hypothetical protein
MFIDYVPYGESIKWFIGNVLPFLNAKTDKELLNSFVRIVIEREEFSSVYGKAISKAMNIEVPGSIYNTPEEAGFDAEEQLEDEDNFNELMESWAFLKEALRIAFSEKTVLNEELENRIKKNLAANHTVKWQGKGKTYVFATDKGISNSNLVAEVERDLVSLIVSFFGNSNTFIFSSDSILSKAFAAAYEKIGMCPNCGIFFEKKRKDQEYCSKSCGSNVRVKKAYHQKK